MHNMDYTYTFEYIGDHLKDGQLRLTDHETHQCHDLQVSVDDDQLSLLNYRALPPLLADLIDIAAAVHMADRLSKEKRDLPRRLLLRLPIRERERLDTPSLHEKLRDILYWFTEDQWFFEFLPYTKHGRLAQIQAPLPFSQDGKIPPQVVLWSGGLDAFAGVYQLLLRDDVTPYILFGTGSNDMISHTQKLTANHLEVLFPQRTQLVQLPFRLRDEHQSVRKNASARSRGFVFMLLGAICAYQQGQDTLFLCENGIGAMNLPFRKSEVSLDHSRSVHPLSLLAISEMLSSLFAQPFTIENPFLLWTKAQMCKEPLQQGACEAVFSTISCDSRHRKRPTQCGYCSSCLLRRQAIAVHGIADRTGYQITERGKQDQKTDDSIHYYAMLEQVNTMRTLLAAPDPWQRMSQHYRGLVDIAERAAESIPIAQQKILCLYQTYVQEWDTIGHIIGPEFLE